MVAAPSAPLIQWLPSVSTVNRHQNVGILIMSEPTEPFPPQPPVNYEQNKQPSLQARKRGVPVWAWMLMTLTSVALVVAVIGISVMVGAGSVTPAAQTSKNETACKLFEDGVNQLTDAYQLALTDGPLAKDAIIAAHDMLPSRIRDAEDKAEGDVAVAIRQARELAPTPGIFTADDTDVAFFMSQEIVAEKCKADGATIDIHRLHK